MKFKITRWWQGLDRYGIVGWGEAAAGFFHGGPTNPGNREGSIFIGGNWNILLSLSACGHFCRSGHNVAHMDRCCLCATVDSLCDVCCQGGRTQQQKVIASNEKQGPSLKRQGTQLR
jgi:hypothetical protein